MTNNEFTGSSQMKEVHYKDGSLMLKGAYAYSREGILSNLKVGKWIEYYPNGQIKAEGNYEIGQYIQCCGAGPCMWFYNFKQGPWNYYYNNGLLKAKGEYEIQNFYISTNCKGGDQLRLGILGDSWIFYDMHGQKVDLNDSLKTQLELIPLNGHFPSNLYFKPNLKSQSVSFERIGEEK